MPLLPWTDADGALAGPTGPGPADTDAAPHLAADLGLDADAALGVEAAWPFLAGDGSAGPGSAC